MDAVKNRYMLDTNALNRIICCPEDEMIIYQSKFHGFEYYFTEIQVSEAAKTIEKVSLDIPNELVERSRAEKAIKLLSLIVKLQTKYVGQIATLRKSRWVLDGTFELLPDNEESARAAFERVLIENDYQYYNDAMIAMTAVPNKCRIVSNDRDFFRKFNKVIPGEMLIYEDFLQIVKESMPSV